MQFVKQSFMGIELDILVGHPEHDLLFIANQVATAAGLREPRKSVSKYLLKRPEDQKAIKLGECLPKVDIKSPMFRRWKEIWMVPETTMYQMLLRGHAPASEPFRKWVTEEVLPSIRKTGSYNVNESTTETGHKFAGELAELHAIITGFQEAVMARFGHLEEAVALLGKTSQAPIREAVESPYEGQKPMILTDVFSAQEFYRIGESRGFSRTALVKIRQSCPPEMETMLDKMWATEDGRKLRSYTSARNRKWTMFPDGWLKAKMTTDFYGEAIMRLVSKALASH